MFLLVTILLLIVSFIMALLSLTKELKKRGEITISKKGYAKEKVLFSRD